MDGLWTDLRYGARRLLANPGFSLAAILTLGLGIGANTAIYSIVDGLLLRPLPYRNPDTLVQLHSVLGGGFMNPNLRYDAFIAWREQRELFAQVEAFDARSQTFQGSGEPEHIQTAALTGGMMSMLGVHARLGRILLPDDAQPGRDMVAVIGEGLWRRHFGARADIVGTTIRLDDARYEIVGVMDARFKFPYINRQVWVPLIPRPAAPGGRSVRYETLAQLKDGVTLEQAQERAKAIADGLNATAGAARTGVGLTRFMSRRVNRSVEQALYALFGAVAVLLLIASANIANLLLVQGAGREREVAVRASLGAARARLVRQLLTETLLLAMAGGAAGVVLAMWGVDLLGGLAPRAMTYFSSADITLDARSLAFALALTLVTAVLFGTLPALKASRTALHDALKAGARSATGAPRHRRLRGAFVVVQLALSLVLLVAAGLLTRTFVGLTRVDPGFRTDNLVAATLSLPSWKYRTPASRQQMMDTLLERLRAIPAVRAVTLSDGVPPGGGGVRFGMTIQIDGRGTVMDDPQVLLPSVSVQPDYFSLLGIPILRGRAFSAADSPTAPKAIIVNETMARRLWGTTDPVGQRVRFSEKGAWYTVVGVAGDVFQFDHSRPADMFGAYYPLSQSADTEFQLTYVLRTNGDTASAIAAAKAQIWSVDPGQPIFRIETARDMYGEFLAEPRFYAAVMLAFGAIGLAIAAIGLYGVLSYTMAQRTREFGIRLALGARPVDIMRLALRHGAALTALGLLAGAAASLLAAPALGSMLVGMPAGDPATYLVVAAALGTTALVACWLPGRRATRTDPVTALRAE